MVREEKKFFEVREILKKSQKNVKSICYNTADLIPWQLTVLSQQCFYFMKKVHLFKTYHS